MSLESKAQDNKFTHWRERTSRRPSGYTLTPRGHIRNVITGGKFVKEVNAATIERLQEEIVLNIWRIQGYDEALMPSHLKWELQQRELQQRAEDAARGEQEN